MVDRTHKVKTWKTLFFSTGGFGDIICKLQGFYFSFSFISRRF